MRIQETKRVIAIVGESCSGKTTVSEALGLKLSCSIRHCGRIVNARANELGVSTANLSNCIHKAIDEETRDIVRNAQTTLVVEGRFLLEVLADAQNVVFLELACNDTERVKRFAHRGATNPVDEMSIQDGITRGLRESLYGGSRRNMDELKLIETSYRSIGDITEEILAYVKQVFVDKI